MRIPLSAPDITDAEIQAVADVLRTPNLSLGPKVREFECAISNYVGTSEAIAVHSGTSALHLCIRSLGISKGDEVIVPSFAFIAVANVVRYEGATPVFVDIDSKTLNLDPDKVEAAVTPRTKAILIVHTFGCPAEMSALLEIARRHRLYVIEDACEAIGAEYDGRKVGALGDVGVFAFYPNKQITTGEGGAIVTNNAEFAAKIRRLRNQGRDESDEWIQYSELGYNYRISDINCALGIEQLNRIDSILDRREAIAREYSQRLGQHPNLKLPPMTLSRRKISWFVYVVRLGDRLSRDHRDWIANEMKLRGIGAARYFAPIHLQPIYRSCTDQKSALLITEFCASRSIALPFYNRVRREQIAEVCRVLIELVQVAATRSNDPR